MLIPADFFVLKSLSLQQAFLFIEFDLPAMLCSTQLSMKIFTACMCEDFHDERQLPLFNTDKHKYYPAHRLKRKDCIFFNIFEHDKFHAHFSMKSI